MAELYRANFDLFINNEMRVNLDKIGYRFLMNCQVKSSSGDRKLVTLPKPNLLFVTPSDKPSADSTADETKEDQKLESDDEKETLHQILFNPTATCGTQEQVYPPKK